MRILAAITILVIIILQCHLWFAKDGLLDAVRLRGDVKELQEKNSDLAKRNAAINLEIESLKKGGNAIENKARSDLGMVKKGEVFYQVVK